MKLYLKEIIGVSRCFYPENAYDERNRLTRKRALAAAARMTRSQRCMKETFLAEKGRFFKERKGGAAR